MEEGREGERRGRKRNGREREGGREEGEREGGGRERNGREREEGEREGGRREEIEEGEEEEEREEIEEGENESTIKCDYYHTYCLTGDFLQELVVRSPNYLQYPRQLVNICTVSQVKESYTWKKILYQTPIQTANTNKGRNIFFRK